MSDFFLWGGFVFSLLWHLALWMFVYERVRDASFPVRKKTDGLNITESVFYTEINTIKFEVTIINFALSGVALCVFGYLAFG